MEPFLDPEEPALPPLPGPTAVDPRQPPYHDPREVQGALKARWNALEREDGFLDARDLDAAG